MDGPWDSPPTLRRGTPEPEYQTRQGGEDFQDFSSFSQSDSEAESDCTDSENGSSHSAEESGSHATKTKPGPQVPSLSLGSLSLSKSVVGPAQASLPPGLSEKLSLPLGKDSKREADQVAVTHTSPSSSLALSGDSCAREKHGQDYAQSSERTSTGKPSSTDSGNGRVNLSLQLPRSPVDQVSGYQRGGNNIPESSAGAEGIVAVDLVSTGFQLNLGSLEADASQSTQDCSPKEDGLDQVRSRCVRSLGISPSDLAFYEIRRLEDGVPIPAGCRHIGVSVKPSLFSLSALEDLLAENQRLSAMAEKSNAALTSLENMTREQAQTFSKEKLRSLELEADNKRMRDRVSSLESHVEALKTELSRSEGLRLMGQKHLTQLQREFEALTCDLTAEELSRSVPTSSVHAGDGDRHPPEAFSGASQAPAVFSSRMEKVLSRLCSEEVLSRLEKCLGVDSPGCSGEDP
uniref:Uncharacterized protein n=3 Tax=Tetraselmis sp. GSL018 TaxID=582737 RepID=A0A061R804_9CHLO|mmetsp:Transcript_1735/g.4060  ORF Transcript_1735/g.4060 Transcript_1735/m.4060 type:complete len:461 (-) Transcript_1735:441-1823(-)